MSAAVELAEWLRDERLAQCKHSTLSFMPTCSPCLRDRLLTSKWLAKHNAAIYLGAAEDARAWLADTGDLDDFGALHPYRTSEGRS